MTVQAKQIAPFCWEIEPFGNMRVPGRVYADEGLMAILEQEKALEQVANVAHLPGIVTASFAMPDIHWGYGFPIGGVAAFDAEEGVISPGGVGYDINCGVRLAGTGLLAKDLKGKEDALADALFANLPSGVGSTGFVKLKQKELKKVLEKGAKWAVENSMGFAEDIERTEENGCMADADASALSERAVERGLKQLGTLGSGNHFVEVGLVDEVFDEAAAGAYGLFAGQVTVMLHSGSRGLGYQVCDDNLATMRKNAPKLDFVLPDRQLSCAHIN
ncbi:MAG: RtcB family protein, partial [Desulfatibacillaceae bacterium]|nr:RtcB family protein [Desulfatibacillaceae bacterium]